MIKTALLMIRELIAPSRDGVDVIDQQQAPIPLLRPDLRQAGRFQPSRHARVVPLTVRLIGARLLQALGASDRTGLADADPVIERSQGAVLDPLPCRAAVGDDVGGAGHMPT